MAHFLEENPTEKETIDGDIWVSPEQATDILDSLNRRQKRKLAFFNSKNQKWTSPIIFVIASGLSTSYLHLLAQLPLRIIPLQSITTEKYYMTS